MNHTLSSLMQNDGFACACGKRHFGQLSDCIIGEGALLRLPDILGKYGDRLAATHLNDNDGERDIHLMALDGTIDWEATAKSLAKCPYALESLVSETSGSTGRKMGGKSAAEIEEIFKNTKSYRDGVLDISDNLLLAYQKMNYEEKFDRLYKNMRTIADMVEAAAKAGSSNA